MLELVPVHGRRTVPEQEGQRLEQLASGSSAPESPDYAARLRRRWWVVVRILVGLTAGYLWNTTRVSEYTSTAAVLVLPTGANTTATAGGRSNAEINLDTESELVQSAKGGGCSPAAEDRGERAGSP